MAASWRGAPLTKVLASLLFVGPLVSFLGGERALAALTLTSSRQVWGARTEPWRLLTSLLTADALLNAGVSYSLLWALRLFERQLGSSKFAAFVASSALAAAASRAALAAVPALGGAGFAAGPFHVMFGLLPLYYSECARGARAPLRARAARRP